jgi:hypothetical protein
MPDKTLTILIAAVVVLSAAHDLDHLLRDDFSRPSSWTIARLFLFVKYALTGAALYFYFRGSLGAKFWSAVGAAGAALLWFAHLRAGSDQRPADIYAKYADPAAGAAAAGVVYALMAALLALAVYGAWRSATRRASG